MNNEKKGIINNINFSIENNEACHTIDVRYFDGTFSTLTNKDSEYFDFVTPDLAIKIYVLSQSLVDFDNSAVYVNVEYKD